MVKVIICGCGGKMGRVVGEILSSREDMQVVAGIDIANPTDLDFPVYSSPSMIDVQTDVIIDFSHPSLLNSLLAVATAKNIGLVLCTTGLSKEQIDLIHDTAKVLPVFFSANMSLGVNLIADLAKKAATILEGFDIEIIEKHHNQKIDAPSGTAIMIADEINSVNDNKYEYVNERYKSRKKRTKNEIGFHAVRGGTIVGEHDIIFAGKDEVVTISHSATSKEVFATGAVAAAKFISEANNGLYSMKDII